MTPQDRQRQIDDIFIEASRRAPNEQRRYLDQACKDLPEDFRVEVEQLLSSDREVVEGRARFLDRMPANVANVLRPPRGDRRGQEIEGQSATPEKLRHDIGNFPDLSNIVDSVDSKKMHEGAGATIGPYKLLQQIGEGGFGVVYMAQQTESIQRRVALKIIKLGMDTKQVVGRFEAERQALALMDHPNIAKVLDAGSTKSGRPYFVMELVRGVPITDFCDENKLTTNQRLELFIPVCQAIQHAHQKAIIHRDIKPSNVLVTTQDNEPVPKVIDFGIAKATQSELTTKTVFTQFQQIVGTPAYMSPEQAQMTGLDIDTRCDVYALGVLLYELLTGMPPFDPKDLLQGGIDEICRRIREDEPPRPSSRISRIDANERASLARTRDTDGKKFGWELRGDLDRIILKAMEKDRRQRYETASGFAADVRRYLNHQPIEARRPSTLGRVRKFVRRNRLAVTLSSCAVLAIVAAIALAINVSVSSARNERISWAREFAIPEINRLLDDFQLMRAFQLAKEAKRHIPDDPALKEIWNKHVTTATVESQPLGARVYVKDWHSQEDWFELGTTPLNRVELPQDIYSRDRDKGVLRWRFVKVGFQTREFNCPAEKMMDRAPIKLPDAANAPTGMVYICPGKSSGGQRVGAFWIDCYEATNGQFQKFVDAGGYRHRKFWKHDFVVDGKTVSWEEAIDLFRDQSGELGPATWSNGEYPAGHEKHPVRGVSWYEAAAYAEFVGKELPTIHHWRWAANVDGAHYIAPISNFSGRGAQPCGSYPGIGQFDVYDMAGNVKEWCWNETGKDRRCLCGGAWSDPSYMFISRDAHFASARPPSAGFRCVSYLEPPSPETLAPRQHQLRDYAAEARSSREEIESYLAQFYDYDQTELRSRRVAVEETDLYVEETVSIEAAYGGQRFDIHLLLPRHVQPPYEPILLFPHGGALRTRRFEFPEMEGDPRYVLDFVEKGRAICWPVFQGTYERRQGLLGIPQSSNRMRNWIVEIAMDLRRSVDYLETRSDMDMNKLAYVGHSWGAGEAPTMLVAEPRFKAAVLIGGGYFSFTRRKEVDAYQFAPYVQLPILMLNGRYDHESPIDSSQMPLFTDLGSADKQIRHFDSAHGVPVSESVKVADEWLREKLHSIESD